METFFNVYLHTECEQAFSPQEQQKTFPVFVKGSKRSNFLVNNAISKQLLSFPILLFEEASACAHGELNIVSGTCLASKKGDANTDSPEALKRTLL